MTEILDQVRDARNNWTDFVQGKGTKLSEVEEVVSRVEEAVDLGTVRKGYSYSKEGMENLARLGYLRRGDLSGVETVMHKGQEYPVAILPLNLNTKSSPNYWSMVIPMNPGTQGIFLPSKYPEDEE